MAYAYSRRVSKFYAERLPEKVGVLSMLEIDGLKKVFKTIQDIDSYTSFSQSLIRAWRKHRGEAPSSEKYGASIV